MDDIINDDQRDIRISLNDFILLFTIFYSVFDIFIQWNKFKKCYKPIQLWLIISFLSIALFRLSHFLLQYISQQQNIIYRRNNVPFYIAFMIIGIFFPFFIIWNIIGTIWIYKIIKYTPFCLPKNNHSWFIILWIILCYIWIFIYLFFIILSLYLQYQANMYERITNINENTNENLNNNNIFYRWSNNIDLMRDYGIFIYKNGLTLKQIQKLPFHYITNTPPDIKCSICLNNFIINDCVRTLILCNHTFHKKCIDMWLLRNASCPNCKTSIASEGIFSNV